MLEAVIDPELHSSIVELGMVRDVAVDEDGIVSVEIALTIAACPLRGQIEGDVDEPPPEPPRRDRRRDPHQRHDRRRAGDADGPGPQAGRRAGPGDPDPAHHPDPGRGQRQGRGGQVVGDRQSGRRAGRPRPRRSGSSTPTSGASPSPACWASTAASAAADGKIHPNEVEVPSVRPGGPAGTLKVVSMGFLVDDEGMALMWRGLVLAKAVEQFLTDVRWGDLDYLLVDMPPGTGDIQMALSRLLPRAELLVVTTPALAAQKVAVRVADMARRSYLKVAGVVENMSAFTCDHGESYALFGSGGGQALADEVKAPAAGRDPARAGRGRRGRHRLAAGAGRAAERRRAGVPPAGPPARDRDHAAGGDGRLHRPRLRRRQRQSRRPRRRQSRRAAPGAGEPVSIKPAAPPSA